MLNEGKNNEIYNNIEIKDLLPDLYNKNNISINYEIIDYTNLYKLLFDNNIPYLKEIVKENSKNIKIELGLLKIENSDIKLDKNFFNEKFMIISNYRIINDHAFVVFCLFIIIFAFINIASFLFLQTFINKNEAIVWKDYSCSLISKLIIGGLIIDYQIKLYYKVKSNLEKEYTLNDEYYSVLKSIKNNIIFIFLVFLLSESNIIIYIIQRINLNYIFK